MDYEIEFLAVGEKSKAGDAIVIRYGSESAYNLMLVDGGHADTGRQIVEHVQRHFPNRGFTHVVLTHADADHASGLRVVLEEMQVENLWMHIPWADPAASLPYFADKSFTVEGLQKRLAAEYDLLADLFRAARGKNIPIRQPFTGANIGPFRVLSPDRDIYALLLPQFDRTPDPDQQAIEDQQLWIGTPMRQGFFGGLMEKAAEAIQKVFKESWTVERLKDGGRTSASNESSVVLYGDFGPNRRVLLTGDAGCWALTLAAIEAEQKNIPLHNFAFVQIPHHGSRRNVGPTILNRLLGPIVPQERSGSFTAFVSAPKDDETHPRQMVLNAFLRRGARVHVTQGTNLVHSGGFRTRSGYGPAPAKPFVEAVEDYD